MEFFYSENLTEQSKQIELSQGESRHVKKALRKKSGDSIQIANGNGILATAVIADDRSRTVTCNIHSTEKIEPLFERNIHIALSTIRPNRMDWAVEKLVELGVGTISFFHSQFTSVRSFKASHLKKIAISAIKQSRQAYLPRINAPLPFGEWIQSFEKEENQIRLLAHLNNSVQTMHQLQSETDHPHKESPIVVAVGPEGGFSEEELTIACERGFRLVSLDNHILRTETAAVVAAVQAKFLMGKIIEDS